MLSGLWSGFHGPMMGEHRMVRLTRQRKQQRPEAKAALTFGQCAEIQQILVQRRWVPDAGSTVVRKPRPLLGREQTQVAHGGW